MTHPLLRRLALAVCREVVDHLGGHDVPRRLDLLDAAADALRDRLDAAQARADAAEARADARYRELLALRRAVRMHLEAGIVPLLEQEKKGTDISAYAPCVTVADARRTLNRLTGAPGLLPDEPPPGYAWTLDDEARESAPAAQGDGVR